MKKFNKQIKEDCTYVLFDNCWYLVKAVTHSRNFLKVYGLQRILRPEHLIKFTNKNIKGMN